MLEAYIPSSQYCLLRNKGKACVWRHTQKDSCLNNVLFVKNIFIITCIYYTHTRKNIPVINFGC